MGKGLELMESSGYMWLKQCHVYQPFFGMEHTVAIKMVMTGGWSIIVLPCFTHILNVFDDLTLQFFL